MEKNQFLDSYRKAIGLIVCIIMLTSCSMPRIILLRDPLTSEERINLGLSYEKNGEYEAALQEYGIASKKLPIAYLYIGNLLFQRYDLDKAKKAYELAIRKTDDPRAYNNLAWLYYVSDGDLEEAEALARRAVELSRDNLDYIDTLTRIVEKRNY